jgi:hypothetical protein
MTTTRPGFIWSGTEWVAIGQEAIVNPFYYQATAPTTPSTGDIWIESDVDVPSVDSAQFLRWRKTMAGGETSLSGNDDSSLPLGYTPGYEQLYINGVLMVRGVDYTATDGTTVTGLTALVADDVVEVFSTLARTVADVYTQTQSDAKYALQTTVPAGTWTTWNPTISGGWAVGNGTWDASYVQIGKTVHMAGKFTVGSTTTKGSGFTITLPVSMAANRGQVWNGVAVVAGGSIYRLHWDNTGTTTTTAWLGYQSAVPGYTGRAAITATVPLTWATGDSLAISGTYEAA